MHKASQLIDEYLSAHEVLKHSTKGRGALQKALSDALKVIVNVCHGHGITAGITIDTVDTVHKLMSHVLIDRYRLGTEMETQLVPYFHFNELTQLLLLLHDTLSDTTIFYKRAEAHECCINSSHVDIKALLAQYKENYHLLCTHYPYRHRDSSWLPLTGARCLVPYCVANAMRIFVAHAAYRELHNIINN